MSDSSTFTPVRETPLLTVVDVAGWLNISPATLRYWRHVHRGPRSVSVGGAVRYRARDIEDWLEHRTTEGSR